MKPTWDMVGGQGRPIHDTQKSYLEQTTVSWGGQPQIPMLPQGPQPTPYIITGSGSGSR